MEERKEQGKRIPLELEVEPGADPIAGRLADDDGNAYEFVGWLGLGAALEKLLDAEHTDPASPGP